ncbi:MAG: SPOR domain-containing protein [Candidatus Korobacteraceae bacterium]|jgi:cell division septation protein DedD
MASDDTEITLGMGKLLGLFFLLAAICGVFFSIGYSLGKNTGREQALNDQPATAATEPAAIASGSSQNKPSAVVAVRAEAGPAPQEQFATSNPQSNLTFYKAVQQTGDGTPSSPKETPSAAPANATTAPESAPVTTAKSATPPSAASSSPAPQVTRPAPVTGPGTIVVQIAAISREDDAVALAGALRKKNYNVFVVNNPITNDKLYHVQVGPFTSIQDAEAMKAKLTGEGYNPILKR